jgi:MOSC domain-containing protein YiiM
MASITLFTGVIRPLPETGRPTGIYKTRVEQPIALGHEGFAGDQQADRRVHGGPDKAVHLYPRPALPPPCRALPGSRRATRARRPR